MRPHTALLMLLSILLVFPLFAGESSNRKDVARQGAEALIKGEYEKAFNLFNAKMKQALPQDKLEMAVMQVRVQYGKFEKIADEKEVSPETFDFSVKCRKGVRVFRISVDQELKIQGLFFLPDYSYARTAKVNYLDETRFAEENISCGKKKPLPGTLCVPSKMASRFPVALLISGSGPSDRDETVGANKVFRDLAHGLAYYGIASLRYDKITRVYPIDDPVNFTQKEEVIDPALEWIRLLKAHAKVDPSKIFFIGHSQGASLLPRLLSVTSGIRGAVLMAGNVTPVHELIYNQSVYLYGLEGKVSPQNQKYLEMLKQNVDYINHPDFEPKASEIYSYRNISKAYLLDEIKNRPSQFVASLSLPLLVINGKRDYQVPVSEFEEWRKILQGCPDISFKLYDSLNHLFIEGRRPGLSTPQEYEIPGHVSEEVLKDISDWILKRLKE